MLGGLGGVGGDEGLDELCDLLLLAAGELGGGLEDEAKRRATSGVGSPNSKLRTEAES